MTSCTLSRSHSHFLDKSTTSSLLYLYIITQSIYNICIYIYIHIKKNACYDTIHANTSPIVYRRKNRQFKFKNFKQLFLKFGPSNTTMNDQECVYMNSLIIISICYGSLSYLSIYRYLITVSQQIHDLNSYNIVLFF